MILKSADHKVFSEGCESRNNHRYALVAQYLATQWIQSYPCKAKKLLRKRRRAYKSSLSRRGNQKSFTLTTPKNLANLVKIFLGIILRQHRTDRKLMGLLRERYAGLRKGPLQYCCKQFWTKNGGRIPWNAAALCETFKISCLMGRHPMKGGSEYDSMAQLFRLEPWLKNTLFLLKTCRDCTNSARKFLPGIFHGNALHAGGFWKGDFLVADIGGLEQMGASEIYAKRLNAKEVLTMSGEKFIFPIADGTVKLSGGDQVLGTSTLVRDRPDRGEEQGNLRGESDGSSSTPLRDSSWCDGEAWNDFWSISGNFCLPSSRGAQSQTVRAERSITPYSTEIYRRDQDYKCIIGCNVGEIFHDYWNVDGDRELSETRTGFTRFTILNEKPPDGCTWSGIRLTGKQNDLQARHFVARDLESNV